MQSSEARTSPRPECTLPVFEEGERFSQQCFAQTHSPCAGSDAIPRFAIRGPGVRPLTRARRFLGAEGASEGELVRYGVLKHADLSIELQRRPPTSVGWISDSACDGRRRAGSQNP